MSTYPYDLIERTNRLAFATEMQDADGTKAYEFYKGVLWQLNMLTESDTCIRDDVWLNLKSDPKISSEVDIGAAATNGVVTLTGFVSSFWEKDSANEATMQVHTVKGVANDIQVRPFCRLNPT